MGGKNKEKPRPRAAKLRETANMGSRESGPGQSQALKKSPGKPRAGCVTCRGALGLDQELLGTLATLPIRCHLVAPVARTSEGAIQVDTLSVGAGPLHKALIHICVTGKRATWHGRVLRSVPTTRVTRALC